MCRMITTQELQRLSLPELQALFRQIQSELAQSGPSSGARRNALASLETIAAAIRARQTMRLHR